MRDKVPGLGLWGAALLTGAAPLAPAQVPIGVFRTWGGHPGEALHIRSGDMRIDVVATPCAAVPQNEGCRYDGNSNQATVTVMQAGRHPFTMTSDRQASFVRVAAMRLTPNPGRLGVVVDNQWGGSGGLTRVSVIEPSADGFRMTTLQGMGAGSQLTGEIADRPADRDSRGRLAFTLEGRGFVQGWTCAACRRGPPLVLAVHDGRSVDVSADPAVRPVFARDIARQRRVCLSHEGERNGGCSAYVMDAARLGRLGAAWREMLSHYERHPAMAIAGGEAEAVAYPAALRDFLAREGYITPARAARLPLV